MPGPPMIHVCSHGSSLLRRASQPASIENPALNPPFNSYLLPGYARVRLMS